MLEYQSLLPRYSFLNFTLFSLTQNYPNLCILMHHGCSGIFFSVNSLNIPVFMGEIMRQTNSGPQTPDPRLQTPDPRPQTVSVPCTSDAVGMSNENFSSDVQVAIS